jgi:hypothetical protein
VSSVLSAQADSLDWTPVSSSNVQAVAYAADFARLFVRFKSGKRYAYEGVPLGVFQGLLGAASKGEYVHSIIRAKGTDSRYPYSGPF